MLTKLMIVELLVIISSDAFHDCCRKVERPKVAHGMNSIYAYGKVV